MSMADLVRAGAPELPEGMFYRIEDTHVVGLRVDIRRRRRFGSAAVPGGDSYVHHEDANCEPGIGAVAQACARAYEKWQQSDSERARYLATTAYIGDHDPRGGR